MTALQNKQLFGYSLVKREKIVPSSKVSTAQTTTPATAQVKTTAKKVIKTHRNILIALRDR